MLSCSIWFSAPSFWMGDGLESRCVGRVYGADGTVSLHVAGKLCGVTQSHSFPHPGRIACCSARNSRPPATKALHT